MKHQTLIVWLVSCPRCMIPVCQVTPTLTNLLFSVIIHKSWVGEEKNGVVSMLVECQPHLDGHLPGDVCLQLWIQQWPISCFWKCKSKYYLASKSYGASSAKLKILPEWERISLCPRLDVNKSTQFAFTAFISKKIKVMLPRILNKSMQQQHNETNSTC